MSVAKGIRKAARRTVPVTLTIAGATVAIAAVPVESPQAGARSWAKSLTTAERIFYSDPDRLSSLPVEYRHGLFAAIPTGEDKAEFWRQVFKEYRRTHNLTTEQQDLLSQTEARLLTAKAFSQTPTPRERLRDMSAARQAIANAISSDAATELFTAAGPQGGSAKTLPLFERVRYAWRTVRPRQLVALVNRIATPVYAFSCNCISGDSCSYNQTCGGAACDQTSWGCGSWWCESCTSICGYYS